MARIEMSSAAIAEGQNQSGGRLNSRENNLRVCEHQAELSWRRKLSSNTVATRLATLRFFSINSPEGLKHR